MPSSSSFDDGITPAARAATTGHPELARYLVAHGAAVPDLRPEQRFVAAALVADQATVAELQAAHPGLAALHVAAMEGRLDLARSLLGLGADPDTRDHRFGSTPLGWARHFGHEELAALLEPLTTRDQPAPGP